MPQLQLPIFAPGMTVINANLGYMHTDNSLTYFYGCLNGWWSGNTYNVLSENGMISIYPH